MTDEQHRLRLRKSKPKLRIHTAIFYEQEEVPGWQWSSSLHHTNQGDWSEMARLQILETRRTPCRKVRHSDLGQIIETVCMNFKSQDKININVVGEFTSTGHHCDVALMYEYRSS